MSGGIESLSDADLMGQINALRSAPPAPSPMAAPAPAPTFAGSGGVQVRLGSAASTAPNALSGGISGLSDDELMRQLSASRAPASFDERFGEGTVGREAGEGALYEGMRKRADERLIGEPSAGNAALAGGLRFSNSLGLNLPRNAAAGLATAAGKVGVPGFNPDFGENYQLAKDQEAALGRQNPKSALAGDVAGIGAAMVTMPALGGAASMAGRTGQAMVTGAGYGAAAEYADTKDAGEAVKSGAIGAGIGMVAQPLAEYAIRGAQAVVPVLKKGVAIWKDDGTLTREATNALLAANINPKTVNPQLEEAIFQTFGKKGISEATAREAGAAEFGIPLSRGQATQDPRFVKSERDLFAGERGKGAEERTARFFDEQRAAVDEARHGIGTRLGGEGGQVAHPHEAGEMIAGRAREIAEQAGTWEQRALHEANTALEGVRGPTPIDTTDAAGIVSRGLKDRAAQAKAGYRDAYGDVAKVEGEFAAGALDKLGTRVRDRLPADVPLDEVLTPSATQALRDLDNLPALFKVEDGAGPNLQQFDQVRKRLVAYRKSAANDTDRRAIDRILSEVDQHAEDAAGAGLFGSREAMRAPVDDFPGNAALNAMPVAGGSAAGRERAPETLTQFLGREGGIALDGDARAGDLQRVMTGYGPLARRNGRSLDDLRPRLIEEGFLPPDANGGFARNVGDEVFELIRRERAGEPSYRIQDRDRGATVASQRAGGADDHFSELVQREAQNITASHEAVGLRARDLDPVVLREASESLVHGRHSDPFEAYEAAVMNRAPSARSTEIAVDVPFDGPTARATSSALPGGTTEPVEAMRKARGAFADYQRTFKPQGGGDDVGRAMQHIIERDATPGEVVSMLMGGSRVGNTGLSVRLAGRVKDTLGAESAEWGAVQQMLVSRALGTDASPKAMADRVNYLLNGEGRTLANSVLNKDQIAGLQRFRDGVNLAGKARDAVPEWVGDLARGNFEPARVVDDLFGRATTGAKASGLQLAEGMKKTVGADSAEWAALRSALWQRMTTKAEGGESFGPKELSQRIMSVVEGPGKKLGQTFYSPDELAQMKRFAGQVMFAVPPATARGQSPAQTLGQALKAKLPSLTLNGILATVGYTLAGTHGAGGIVALNMARKGLAGALATREAKAIGLGAPKVEPTSSVRAGAPAGLYGAELN